MDTLSRVPQVVSMASNAPRRSAWFGLAELRPTSRGTLRLRPRWKRIAALSGFLLIAGYLTGALGVFWLYKERKGYSEVAFVDVLLWRRAKIRQEQGEADIARAIEAIEANAFREAFNYLRTGLARNPEHREGRLLLIRMYAQSHPHLAAELFEKGLSYHSDDREYLELYGRFLIQAREDEKLLALVGEVTAEFPPDSEIARMMALFGMHVANRRGEFATAADFYRRYALGHTPEGLLEAAYALEQTHRRPEAIALLQAALNHPGAPANPALYGRLVELLLSGERSDEAITVALDLALKAPLKWEPRLILLNAYESAGREAGVMRESMALLRQFRDDPALVAALAGFAQKTGRVELAGKIYATALEKGLGLAHFGLLYIETHLAAEDYAGALALCQEIEAANPDWLAQYQPQFNGIRSIAAYAIGNPELGNLYQRQFMEAIAGRADGLHAIGRAFQRAGLNEQAFVIMKEAHLRAPSDEGILATLIELQITLRDPVDLGTRVRKLITLRRPDYTVFEKALTALMNNPSIDADERRRITAEVEAVLRETDDLESAAFSLPAPEKPV